MKFMRHIYLVLVIVPILFLGGACSDKWDDHYSQQDIVLSSDVVEIVDSSAELYIQSASDLSSISALFTEQNIYDQLGDKDQQFTVLVYANESMSEVNVEDDEFFAQTCVCDLSLTPTKLTEGLSIQMWNGKYLPVTVQEGTDNSEVYISGSKLEKVIQVNNGYVYVMETAIQAPKSLYEVFEALGDEYSLFKELVSGFEENEFDKDNSVPVGVDATGNTLYDSVFVVKNTLMDRYNSGGSATWNMRSEYYSSTLLIPSNDLVSTALVDAYNYVQEALNRIPTSSDSTKFKEWIVKSSFYDYVLTSEMLNGDEDLYSVAGYEEEASSSTVGVQWRPSVQKVNTTNPIELSNGTAYYETSLKIPNNVVIHRIKNCFYRWENCSTEEKEEYFKWTNLENPDIYDSGSFGPLGVWPAVYYKCLRAYPTEDAETNQLPVTVECTGISLNDDGTVSVAMIPPGEYYLRMGFRSDKYPWRTDIYFNDELVAEEVNPNYAHYDRTALGYPEGYVWKDWYSTSNRSAYYDCDGMEIATVTVSGTELQPIKIKMVSNDMTEGSGSRNRMIIYNWCLRPTSDNY